MLTAICLMVAGCAGSHRPAASSASSSLPASPGGLSAWREPARYSFVLDSRCGEQPLIGRFRVAVRSGAVTATAPLDDPAKVALGLPTPPPVPTLGQLLAQVEAARGRGAHTAQVGVDPTDGHPVSVTIDPSATTTDDELCYAVSEYTVSST